jgi:hypothetical protein
MPTALVLQPACRRAAAPLPTSSASLADSDPQLLALLELLALLALLLLLVLLVLLLPDADMCRRMVLRSRCSVLRPNCARHGEQSRQTVDGQQWQE